MTDVLGFRSMRECLAHVVYSCGRPFGHVAADLGYAPAELSRMLADNPNDNRYFPAEKLVELSVVCGEKGELIEAYILAQRRQRQEDALTRAARMVNEHLPKMPELQRELTAQTYFFRGDKFQCTEKKQVKAALGFSPDLADALICTFAFPVAPRAGFRQTQATTSFDPRNSGRASEQQGFAVGAAETASRLFG